MSTIPGASQYLNASTLSNLKGFAARSTDLLSSVSGSISLLEAGRGNSVPGIGLSGNSRSLIRQQLSNSSGIANGLFSATVGETSTVQNLQTQINAIRSRLSLDKVAVSLRGDGGGISASSTGTVVDQKA